MGRALAQAPARPVGDAAASRQVARGGRPLAVHAGYSKRKLNSHSRGLHACDRVRMAWVSRFSRGRRQHRSPLQDGAGSEAPAGGGCRAPSGSRTDGGGPLRSVLRAGAAWGLLVGGERQVPAAARTRHEARGWTGLRGAGGLGHPSFKHQLPGRACCGDGSTGSELPGQDSGSGGGHLPSGSPAPHPVIVPGVCPLTSYTRQQVTRTLGGSDQELGAGWSPVHWRGVCGLGVPGDPVLCLLFEGPGTVLKDSVPGGATGCAGTQCRTRPGRDLPLTRLS